MEIAGRLRLPIRFASEGSTGSMSVNETMVTQGRVCERDEDSSLQARLPIPCASEGSAGSTPKSGSSMCVNVTAATLGRICDVDEDLTLQAPMRRVTGMSL